MLTFGLARAVGRNAVAAVVKGLAWDRAGRSKVRLERTADLKTCAEDPRFRDRPMVVTSIVVVSD
jgi:hypothetical protein